MSHTLFSNVPIGHQEIVVGGEIASQVYIFPAYLDSPGNSLPSLPTGSGIFNKVKRIIDSSPLPLG